MNIFDVLIVQPFFNVLLVLYTYIPGGDFGIAIIAMTILIRFAMWPLVKKQLHQTRKMRELQPELAKIKKQSKGNKQLEGMQMMELYKRHGVSPFRSIGILLIQLPIFIALYQVIQIFTSHRERLEAFTYDFLQKLQPIADVVSNPEDFNEKLLGVIDITQHAISSNGVNVFLVILAVLAAGTQYIMSRQTMPHTEPRRRLRDIMSEVSQGKEPDQAEMNAAVMGKMTKVLPFFMLFVMLNLPGALALYYAVSNLVAVAQQHYILKRDEVEMDKIADDNTPPQQHKKATAKSRAKVAKEANVTKIKAGDK